MHTASPTVSLTCFPPIERTTLGEIEALLRAAGLQPTFSGVSEFTLVLLREISSDLFDFLRRTSRRSATIAIVLNENGLPAEQIWQLMECGAYDVLMWPRLPPEAREVAARFERLQRITNLMESPAVRKRVVGDSQRWRSLLREVVEIGAFTDASILITGESGTGKELLAQLVHQLDSERSGNELIVVDCGAISPELSGSEFFGHERGAFTGAVDARTGAFALANGGTLFLDEVGELPLPLQAQLLRVVQEKKYKRVGSNVWQSTKFRLVCATNRDLEACVSAGTFRADLYHRLAGWICRVPPLRERPEDILALATHFLTQFNGPGDDPGIDESVRQYLLTRSYPGNVRDLRQLMARIWHRHAGPGAITAGDIPPADRPASWGMAMRWPDTGFETAIRHALELRVGLKAISRAAADTAIRIALEQERDNVHRAAVRLGITDRAIQMRRASDRPLH